MENTFIRHAQEAEQEDIVVCIRAAYEKYVARMDKEPAPLRADYKTLLEQGVVYVLLSEDRIRGVLVMMPQGQDLFVENIAIDPCCQGQGLGHTLMAFVEQQAREAHLKGIRLYTNEAMVENLAFYQQLGFEEEGRQEQDGYRRVFLRKALV